ncbi:NTP transferase domain-containing protein [Aureliella helgolandensis]|uniref:2-C-methyl-D-erythritol 4-phosphate cytidylyltransferase n=1 Tax=Aureliella helgolandensis TaxID=2527968 RepID=A0A518G4M1_9BACT|nr:NTP transferase domain-containing protein [Aureliella helgolandensis]QDV23489.1 2-C-methyl-D-erythritol 4-phosphate cytidylyltransferase [Aureliella helgolandensis]
MNEATVVINSAGCGSRLKMQIPKSLVEISGRPILEWQLRELCPSAPRVRIVVGYMGDQVATLARRLRPSIEVIVNEEWKTTKTAASLSLGMKGVRGRCVSLDGDLLVHPADFSQVLTADQDVIGIADVSTSHPVFAVVNDQNACTEMSYTKTSQYEWTGLVNFLPSSVAPGQGNVFEMIEDLLPTQTAKIRCCEVDTPADFLYANRIWPDYAQTMESTYVARYAG